MPLKPVGRLVNKYNVGYPAFFLFNFIPFLECLIFFDYFSYKTYLGIYKYKLIFKTG